MHDTSPNLLVSEDTGLVKTPIEEKKYPKMLFPMAIPLRQPSLSERGIDYPYAKGTMQNTHIDLILKNAYLKTL